METPSLKSKVLKPKVLKPKVLTTEPAKKQVHCPALFLAAPASGQGKTTITAAMARYFRWQGLDVRVFKTGPDYLDPQILQQASGNPVIQLDLWMAGVDYCKHKLFAAAEVADLILIEGAMGMFDGEPSSADLAVTFGVPVAVVMDVKGMAQTAAAVFQGLSSFRDDVVIAGLIANNCGSPRHRDLIEEAMSDELPLIAALSRQDAVKLPERHLGLVQSFECHDEIEDALAQGVKWIEGTALTTLPKPVVFVSQTLEPPPKLLEGVKIGIAQDEAFSFIYDANLDCLTQMGAELHFFSPLMDTVLPKVGALWLAGGYPELHGQALSQNTAMKKAIGAFHTKNLPIIAECGGMIYCAESVICLEGEQHFMANILPGEINFNGRRGCQGMQTLVVPEGDIRGHAHHRSQLNASVEPVSFGKRQRHPANGEPIYQVGSLTASYLHLFFPSNPQAVARLFKGEKQKGEKQHVA